MLVDDPSGGTWRVRRRWLPWRIGPREPDTIDASGGALGDDLLFGVLFALMVTLLLLVMPWLVVGVVLILETVLVLLLTPVAVLLRTVRVGGWPIEVEKRSGGVWARAHGERRRGWAASRQRVDELCTQIRVGRFPGPRHLV